MPDEKKCLICGRTLITNNSRDANDGRCQECINSHTGGKNSKSFIKSDSRVSTGTVKSNHIRTRSMRNSQKTKMFFYIGCFFVLIIGLLVYVYYRKFRGNIVTPAPIMVEKQQRSPGDRALTRGERLTTSDYIAEQRAAYNQDMASLSGVLSRTTFDFASDRTKAIINELRIELQEWDVVIGRAERALEVKDITVNEITLRLKAMDAKYAEIVRKAAKVEQELSALEKQRQDARVRMMQQQRTPPQRAPNPRDSQFRFGR